jgi:hypothetical protein
MQTDTEKDFERRDKKAANHACHCACQEELTTPFIERISLGEEAQCIVTAQAQHLILLLAAALYVCKQPTFNGRVARKLE